MARKTYNVLFICTGNSARSILAEALMNHYGKGDFKAYSAGSHPTGVVHPRAIEQLRTMQLPVDGYRSKTWEEFTRPDAPVLDFVFTVCDKAAGEQCPTWPGRPITANWGLPDPAAVVGTDERRRLAFRDAAVLITRRIQLTLSLPIDKLDDLSLQRQLREIGKQ
jgi:arsenate reductase